MLASRLSSNLASVTMDEMLSAMSGGGPGLLEPEARALLANGSPTTGDVGLAGVGATAPSAAPATGDAWGAAADRPASALTGPGAQVLSAGERYLGVPYKWGGTDPATGFDCSGFVQQVYADLGVRLPRVSIDQSREGVPVASLDEARPGDLVFWNGNGSRPNHIGIYAGEGRMLVAPSSGDVVRYQEISRTPHEIRRIVA